MGQSGERAVAGSTVQWWVAKLGWSGGEADWPRPTAWCSGGRLGLRGQRHSWAKAKAEGAEWRRPRLKGRSGGQATDGGLVQWWVARVGWRHGRRLGTVVGG